MIKFELDAFNSCLHIRFCNKVLSKVGRDGQQPAMQCKVPKRSFSFFFLYTTLAKHMCTEVPVPRLPEKCDVLDSEVKRK